MKRIQNVSRRSLLVLLLCVCASVAPSAAQSPNAVIEWDRAFTSIGDTLYVVTANVDRSGDSAVEFHTRVACVGCVLVSMSPARATTTLAGSFFFPTSPSEADVWALWVNTPFCPETPPAPALFFLKVRAVPPVSGPLEVRLVGSPSTQGCFSALAPATYGRSVLALRPGLPVLTRKVSWGRVKAAYR